MRKISLVAMAAGFAMMLPLAITHAQTAPQDAHHPGATPGEKPAMNSMMDGMMSKMMAGHMNMMMLHHAEGYLAFLKTELQITDAQNAAWTGYADAVRGVAKKAHPAMPAMPGMTPAPGSPAMPAMPAMSLSWPDRLAANEKDLTAQLDAAKTMRPAVTALYAVLTPDQKKKADALGAGAKGMM